MTSLHWATKHGSGEVVELLLKKGADVNAIREDGSSALLFAAENTDLHTFNLLVSHGAKVVQCLILFEF